MIFILHLIFILTTGWLHKLTALKKYVQVPMKLINDNLISYNGVDN